MPSACWIVPRVGNRAGSPVSGWSGLLNCLPLCTMPTSVVHCPAWVLNHVAGSPPPPHTHFADAAGEAEAVDGQVHGDVRDVVLRDAGLFVVARVEALRPAEEDAELLVRRLRERRRGDEQKQ